MEASFSALTCSFSFISTAQHGQYPSIPTYVVSLNDLYNAYSNYLHAYQASLHFCSECNNLLYPKADPERRVMLYACRICTYDEIGDNQCVYRNDLLTVTKYVICCLRRPAHVAVVAQS